MTSARNQTDQGQADGLAGALRRAVEAGIISADQADAVLAAERTRPQVHGPSGGRRLPVTEALGYLGGLLALSGAVTLAVEYWRDVPIAGRLALLAAVAIATWLVGTRIADQAAAALVRLRGALWFASSVAVAAFVGQFIWDVAHGSQETVVLSSGAAAAVHAALLWRGQDRPAQHLACLGGVLTAVGGAAALSADGESVVGLAVAVAATLWVAGGWLRVLPPPALALVGGGAAVLIALAITAGDWSDAAPLLGLAATGVFIAVGVGTDRTPLTVVGLAGAFGYLPWTVGHFFSGSLGVPLAMLLCGIALLAATLLLLRKPLKELPVR
jgi:hypothetical protein